MTLFKKGKGDQGGGTPKAPAFSPIDRFGLLGLLDQVVNGGQSGVLELREPRGNWVYAFQAGALTHASGGRVRGARQAFDLLWEFQSGEFSFTPGQNPGLAGNLYIDKGRLLELLRRSQAVLQGPSAPYIPPDQQRPIAPVNQPYRPPVPGQMPTWQPPAPPGQYPAAPPQGWPPAGQPGMPPAPAWGTGYPQQQGYPGAPYPGAPYPGQPAPGQPYPPQPYPPQPYPPGMSPQGIPPQAMPPQAVPPQAPAARPARPVTPQSFSVPPMPFPKKREPLPTYQPPAAAPGPPGVAEPPRPAPAQDDLAALRASLVAQAPPVRPAPAGPAWGVRTAEGTVTALPVAPVKGKGKGKGNAAPGAKGGAKRDSKLKAAIKVQLITFLLWACERKYSPDDHWTLKDAFEVSTMELRDQFFSAFSQSLKSANRPRANDDDDDMDDMAAGRMRGRGRRH
ncbi:MAG: DUF4388 domain-containing protein [Chloroflexi bacterium]|nr:MAG: DUF4388 domain-containing protein [Chloroflexota bacterium]